MLLITSRDGRIGLPSDSPNPIPRRSESPNSPQRSSTPLVRPSGGQTAVDPQAKP